MITRTDVRTCDRCGATTTSVDGVPEPLELMEVGIALRFDGYRQADFRSEAPTAHWSCCHR